MHTEISDFGYFAKKPLPTERDAMDVAPRVLHRLAPYLVSVLTAQILYFENIDAPELL